MWHLDELRKKKSRWQCRTALFPGKGCAQVGKNLRLEKWDVRVICLTMRNAGKRSYRGMINGENVGEDVCGSPLTSVLYHIFFENFVTQVTQYRKRYTNNKFLPIFFVHPGE